MFTLLVTLLLTVSWLALAKPQEISIGFDRAASVALAVKHVKHRDLAAALSALEPVLEFDISKSDDRTQLETTKWMSRLAHGLLRCNREAELRRVALEIGKRIYKPDNFRLKEIALDLEHALQLTKLPSEEVKLLEEMETRLSTSFETALYREDHSEALNLSLQIWQRQKEILGNDHPNVIMSLNNVAEVNRIIGNAEEAVRISQKVVTGCEKVFGKSHPRYAIACRYLAEAHLLERNSVSAKASLGAARESFRVAFRYEPDNYADCLLDLARVHLDYYDFSAAHDVLMESWRTINATTGNALDAANILANISSALLQTGRYHRAKEVISDALELLQPEKDSSPPGKLQQREKRIFDGQTIYMLDDTPDYALWKRRRTLFASLMNNQASACQEIGEIGEAIRSHWIARDTRKSIMKIESTLSRETNRFFFLKEKYVESTANLAGSLGKAGDLKMTEELYEQALQETAPASMNRAIVLIQLGRLALQQERAADAETCYLKAQDIIHDRKLLKVVELAHVWTGLSQVARSKAQLDQAVTLLEKSKDVFDSVLGVNNPESVEIIVAMASVAFEQNKHDKAKDLLNNALKHIPGGTARANAKSILAAVYFSENDFHTAAKLYEESIALSRQAIENASISLSERQQLAMGKLLRGYLDLYIACCIQIEELKPNAVMAMLSWKGSTLTRQRAIRVARTSPQSEAKFSELRGIVGQLAMQVRSHPDPEKLASWKLGIQNLRERKERLESDLVIDTTPENEANEPRVIDQVCASLAPEAVLIDYLAIGKNQQLVAAVITSDGVADLIELGQVSEITKLVGAWRQTYGESDQSIEAGSQLRELIWDPLSKFVDRKPLVLVSPDGILGNLPFNALPGSIPGSYLIEEHTICLVTVPKLLGERPSDDRGSTPTSNRTQECLLIGDVDYQSASRNTAVSLTLSPSYFGEGPPRIVRSGGRREKWTELPGTREELDSIGDLLSRQKSQFATDAIRLSGAAATESAFRDQAERSSLVHIATHGFSSNTGLAFTAVNANESQKPVSGMVQKGQHGFELSIEPSPGQLSGLVFAGANTPFLTNESLATEMDLKQADDGILTADEIAMLRLGKTSLVVLSACETGIGTISSGEGMLGVQRAFQVAGVASTIASLWKVDDQATVKLMTRFYDNLLVKRMSKADALRDAQLWMLRNGNQVFDRNATTSARAPGGMGTVRKSAKRNVQPSKRLSPKFWAAFTLSGDWN